MKVGDKVLYRHNNPRYDEEVTITKIEDNKFYAYFTKGILLNKEQWVTIDHLTLLVDKPLKKHRVGICK